MLLSHVSCRRLLTLISFCLMPIVVHAEDSDPPVLALSKRLLLEGAGPASFVAPRVILPPGTYMEGPGLYSFPPSGTPALLGSGFDSVTSTVMGDCVDANVPTATILPKDMDASGQGVVYKASGITSIAQLRRALNVSASASFSYGIYSGGGDFNLFQNDSVNSFSSYMFLSVGVENQRQVLTQKNLKVNRAEVLRNSPENFRKGCGDQFVSGISTGGLLTAVVKFEARSEAHQQAISAAVNGAIGGFGSASGSLDSKFESLESMASYSIVLVRKGDNERIPSLKSLARYASSFPKKVAATGGHPWVFTALTSSYDTVDNLPTDSSPYVYAAQEIFLEGLATLRDVAVQKRNDLLYVYANPDQFEAQDRSTLQANVDKVNKHIDAVMTLANACKVDPRNRCSGSYPNLDQLNIPDRKKSGATAKLDLAEELFVQRGDLAKNDAALAVLSTIDEAQATQDERYHAALLTAEALEWRAARGYLLFIYDTDKLPPYSAALAKAVGLSAGMAGKPCEADFLAATELAMTDKGTKNILLQTTKATMDTLIDRSTRTGKSCKSYLWNGVDRWRAWMRYSLSVPSSGLGESERATLKQEALKAAEDAFNAEPDHPGNVIVWISVHDDEATQCKILNDYLGRSVPSKFRGLEPGFSLTKGALRENSGSLAFLARCKRIASR